MIFDFPEGLVEIDSDDGARPMKVKGKFADGTGKVETRTFTSKHLYFVNAVKAGQMEMLIIPEGAISKTQSQRHKIVVMGQGPIPPPDPDPEPEPEPEPMPVPTGNVVISIVEDAQNRKPDTAILLNAMAGWNALKDAGNDWRLYDVATSEPKGKQAVEDAKSAELPAMIIRDKETDKILRVIPLPKDFDSLKRILSELGVKCV
jgi:outer membrane biosynthesis protein TonB